MIIFVVVLSYRPLLNLTFFCLDTKESNKEKVKAVATPTKKWLHFVALKKACYHPFASISIYAYHLFYLYETFSMRPLRFTIFISFADVFLFASMRQVLHACVAKAGFRKVEGKETITFVVVLGVIFQDTFWFVSFCIAVWVVVLE